MADNQPKGYIYAELKVTDPEYFYAEYMTRVKPVLEKYQAKFAIAGNDPEVLEGHKNIQRVVLVEFETLAKAKEFYHSTDYQEVIGYRFRSADTHLYIIEGAQQ
ncbi:DUF1330 domain-containing protein [Paraburkholderia sp. 22B1P]|uniref:DUF1330 domain-containing protein n=1 Tax=Paraburkholderia sp. 22B1P TaxID=3080498 RepID=UPI003092230F|nr:DUF1330 domain-containing protein [Paraburkholderia sp. 22B1P]